MQTYKSYTYSLSFLHKETGKKFLYYGVRYTRALERRTPEEDFLIHYFGSSDLLPEFFTDDYVIDGKIRKKFLTKEAGITHEENFLKRVNAAHNSNWINRHNGGKTFHN